MASAFDTLGSQANGAGDSSAVRGWAALSGLVTIAISLPMCAVLVFGSEHIAGSLLGMDAEASTDVAAFCTGLVPGMIPAGLSRSLEKYLTVKGSPGVVGCFVVLSLFVNLALNAVLVTGWGGWGGLGIAGSPLATSCTRTFQLLCLLGYCAVSPSEAHGTAGARGGYEPVRDVPSPAAVAAAAAVGGAAAPAAGDDAPWADAWRGLKLAITPDQVTGKREALRRYVRLGSSGAAMFVTEALSFDVTVSAAARLGRLPLDGVWRGSCC